MRQTFWKSPHQSKGVIVYGLKHCDSSQVMSNIQAYGGTSYSFHSSRFSYFYDPLLKEFQRNCCINFKTKKLLIKFPSNYRKNYQKKKTINMSIESFDKLLSQYPKELPQQFPKKMTYTWRNSQRKWRTIFNSIT